LYLQFLVTPFVSTNFFLINKYSKIIPEVVFYTNLIGGVMVSIGGVMVSISGVMVSASILIAKDCGFRPWSPQTKDYKIRICCFSTQDAALWRKSKDRLARNQNNVSKWGDMSIHGLLF
jgi:hypothetical protein